MRCTTTFRTAFLRLDVDQQAEVLLALRLFRETPRMPNRDVYIIRDTDPFRTDDDVWHLPLRQHGHITYCYLTNAHANHIVCVFRNIGFSEATQPDA